MTVLVTSNPAPVVLPTDFTDDFSGSRSPYLGAPWITAATVMNADTGAPIDGVINAGGGTATFGGAAASNCHVALFPLSLHLPTVIALSLTRGLYSRFKVASTLGAAVQTTGPAVCITPDELGHYQLEIHVGNATRLLRYSGLSVASVVVLASGLFLPAVNDVIELRLQYLAPTVPTLTWLKNGVVSGTYTDSSAGRLQTGGFYGWGFHNHGAGASLGISNYAGGVLAA